MNILAWNAPPPTAELARAIAAHEKPLYLAVCLPDLSLPEFRPSESPSALEQELQQAINAQSGCIQFNGVNALNDILPDVHLWLLPPANASRLHEHFPQPVRWQTEPVAQNKAEPQKPWFSPPASRTPPERALVIGAGIAGAATARALAEHGLPVTVLEAAAPALAASGNRQGLLYAKISAHPTEQTELLLCGYGHSRHLLQRLLPVEIDASRRALVWLGNSGITSQATHPKAQEALRWAAYTYVVAALSSLATLLYYLSIYMGRRD